MKIVEKIVALRKEMKEHGIDAYIVPNSDTHNSEYTAAHWAAREWISGFDGSAGTVLVLANQAFLWTDGRYHIQAAHQLAGTTIELVKAGLPDVPTIEAYLADNLPANAVVGFNGSVVTSAYVDDLKTKFEVKNIKLKTDVDLVDKIWKDRPASPTSVGFEHDVKFAGKSRLQKLQEVRQEMAKVQADNFLLTSLDDIAWLYNLRGTDVPSCPLLFSYTLISKDKATLCVKENKLGKELKKSLLDDGIILADYEDIYSLTKNINPATSVIYSPTMVNYNLANSIPATCRRIKATNITTHLKALKNPTEMANYRNCFVRDGLHRVKFIKWMYDNIGKVKMTEKTASDYLTKCRESDPHFQGLSFTSIPGFKAHGAMMHYRVTPESDVPLEQESFFLLDSGGLYSDGTTDITRTFALGKLTEAEKKDYTLVLKGHIDLSMAVFLHGTRGMQLDILARHPLWKESINYNCGTGHGVGFFLNVHEGPHNISPRLLDEKIIPGMVVTNEPGIYREGVHGVRIENIMFVVDAAQSEFGKFYKFEALTLCPIDTKGIIVEMLTAEEKQWFNDYHKMVYDKLAPHLDSAHQAFLKEITKPI